MTMGLNITFASRDHRKAKRGPLLTGADPRIRCVPRADGNTLRIGKSATEARHFALHDEPIVRMLDRLSDGRLRLKKHPCLARLSRVAFAAERDHEAANHVILIDPLHTTKPHANSGPVGTSMLPTSPGRTNRTTVAMSGAEQDPPPGPSES